MHDPAHELNFLRNKLKLRSNEVKSTFNQKYPHVEKFFSDRGLTLSKIREHSAKIITTSALTGTLLFSPTAIFPSLPIATQIVKSVPKQEIVLSALKEYLPIKVGPLNRSQEKTLEQVFSENLGVKVRANLEGEHLNTTYGYIGAEQHLARFSGDNMSIHPKIPVNDEGMAPGLGAWGYVPEDKEKWYAVVQTLYLPDWNTRQPFLSKWYKGRKVMIVNTMNGNAVVAAIEDAGPAAWTGKHFGGSPEVMNYLGGSRYKKGPVILFFVDDPNNQVQLGPVDYNNVYEQDFLRQVTNS